MNSSNKGRAKLWLGILIACGACFTPGRSQDGLTTNASTTTSTSQCPQYQVFDTSNPTSPQYDAPDGCRCVDGMQGVTCGYCDSDAPCQANHDDSPHFCRKGMVFAKGDTYKAYKCSLFSTLESLYNNGKVDLVGDIAEGTGLLTVYNTASVHDGHVVECAMSGCEFPVGGSGASCASASKSLVNARAINMFDACSRLAMTYDPLWYRTSFPTYSYT